MYESETGRRNRTEIRRQSVNFAGSINFCIQTILDVDCQWIMVYFHENARRINLNCAPITL